jgi:hypothetical protein
MSGARIGFGRFSMRRATLEALNGDGWVFLLSYSRDIEGRFGKCREDGRDRRRREKEIVLFENQLVLQQEKARRVF